MPTLVVTKTEVCTMEINDDEYAEILGAADQGESLESVASEFDCHYFETVDIEVELMN